MAPHAILERPAGVLSLGVAAMVIAWLALRPVLAPAVLADLPASLLVAILAGAAALALLSTAHGLPLKLTSGGAGLAIAVFGLIETVAAVRALTPESSFVVPALLAGLTGLGLALAAEAFGSSPRWTIAFAVVALLAALLVLFRFIFAINPFATDPAAAGPELPWSAPAAALGLLGLAGGLLSAGPARLPLDILGDTGSAGIMVRRLVPLALVLPVILGWVRWMGESAGQYGTEFGLALFSVTNSAILVGTILYTATQLRRVEGERRRLANETRASRDLVVQTLGRISDAFYALDRDYRFTFLNARAERYFGRRGEELLHKRVWDVIPEARGSVFEREYRAAFAGGQPRSFEAQSPLSGRWIEVQAYPGPDGLSVFFRDVHERKRLEAEREQTARTLRGLTTELSRSNSDLQQFAYVVSHDLQEPLRGIAGCIQLLQRRYHDRLDDKAHLLVTHAVTSAQRLETMINSLLDYARVEARGQAFEAVDLNLPLDDALTNLRTALLESGAAVERGDLPSATVDRAQVSRVFQNLLANAIKFRSDRPPIIRIAAAEADGQLRVSVSDNGIGVDQRFAERIFGVFQRLHTRDEYPGTGIGLAIAKRIVERHGGHIGLEPSTEGGSTFFFTLPK